MVQNTTQSIPYKGEGTINIHINNPSVGYNPTPATPAYTYYPIYYPMYYYPPTYYMNTGLDKNIVEQLKNICALQNLQQQKLNTLYEKINAVNSQKPYQTTFANPVQPLAQQPLQQPKNDKVPQNNISDKQKEIVILTNEYIKNLENNLRNRNVELRKNAMKEVLERFKEDKSRISDPALTALLNLGLQDSNGTVKALAFSILDAGYAIGDKTTKTILTNMQNSNNNYSQDAISASNTLLKLSQTKASVNNNDFPKKKG